VVRETTLRSLIPTLAGNICRSPIAEAVFQHVAKERGVLAEWNIDSAATGDWHVGSKPDRRAIQCMKDHNVTLDDFRDFDYIFAMDNANLNDLKDLAPKGSKAKVVLLGKYDPEGQTIIRDPYYVSHSPFLCHLALQTLPTLL
ncbi:protein-tyrosine-phosphatase, putative, partial [Ixodes scapularis]